MKYGYARVSTVDQNPALQMDALKKAKCDYVFQEKRTGATINRPALRDCLKKLRPGDTLIVWRLDRLGRSLRDLITMLDELRGRGIRFQSLSEAIDTETPTGRAMWQLIGVFAELERSIIIERTRAGMLAARKRGIRPGPKPKLSRQQIEHARELRAKRKAPDEIAGILGVSRSTLYRALSY
jgi:DNA invertase Pin-like site-specific DNA recombinase